MSTFSYNGHTYTLSETPKTWLEAQRFAASLNGYLATISSQEENNQILNRMLASLPSAPIANDGGGARYLWLGGSDIASEGTWHWIDDLPISLDDSHWARGALGREPDNFEQQNALALGLEQWPTPNGGIGIAGQWNDLDENNLLFFVIETDKEPILRNPRTLNSADHGYEGVIRIKNGSAYGSGVLLYGGRAVLTAAHLFNGGDNTASVQVNFPSSESPLSVRKISLLPEYDKVNENGDLALVWLATAAPVTANRHELYRQQDEIGQIFSFAGYGSSDHAATVVQSSAWNRFETEAGQIKDLMGTSMGWTPEKQKILVADYDNGTTAQDALGNLIDLNDLGLGSTEGLTLPGDSGGPAFIDGKIAGIASYSAPLQKGTIYSDLDTISNGSFGELGFWQRVSSYQQWIDQSLRAQYTDAPTAPEEVKKSISEGQSGISTAYFLLTFTGVRQHENEMLSVDFSTRDGTATAGQDYLSVSGTLNLYPGESKAVIPVEVLGDTFREADEYFYLDVSNPVGGSFGPGILTLTAVRTILNDDGI